MNKNDTQKNKLLNDLVGLKHDLGKYIRLPLAMLDSEASEAEVRKALQKALLKTQKNGEKTVGAREIWESFLARAQDSLAEFETFDELKKNVEQALSWEAALVDRTIDIDRTIVEDDLEAVGHAIQSVIEEVSGE